MLTVENGKIIQDSGVLGFWGFGVLGFWGFDVVGVNLECCGC